MSIGTEHIIVNESYIQFKEDDHVHSVFLRRPTSLTQDVYIDLPTRNGVTIGPTYVVAGASESVTSSETLQDDNELTIPVVNGRTYHITGGIYTTGPAIKAKLNGTGSGMAIWTDDQTTNWVLAIADTATSITSVIMVQATFRATATGNLTLQWAQNSSNATPSVRTAGSYLAYQEVAAS